MNEAELAARFRAIIETVSTGELEALDHLIRFDAEDHNLIPGQGDGRPGIKYWAKSMLQTFPDISGQVADTVVQNNKVAARVLWAGTNTGSFMGITPTDEYLEFESFYIVRFVDGLAVEWWDGTNMGHALRRIGATISLPNILR